MAQTLNPIKETVDPIFMIDPIRQTALQGLQEASKNINEKAERISSSFAQGEDPTNDIVGLKQDEHAFKANAKMIKVSEQLDQEILDILA